jgi:hypothetical protein
MQTSKHKTYFVLTGYDIDEGREINLRRDVVAQSLHDPELLGNILEVSARNEDGLAQKIARTRALLPADFEFDHQWITTSSSVAWFSRNWFLRVWFELKRRLGRGMRKRLRYWFRS